MGTARKYVVIDPATGTDYSAPNPGHHTLVVIILSFSRWRKWDDIAVALLKH